MWVLAPVSDCRNVRAYADRDDHYGLQVWRADSSLRLPDTIATPYNFLSGYLRAPAAETACRQLDNSRRAKSSQGLA